MKRFEDLPKLMVVTDKPLHDKKLIEVKSYFNSFIIKSLKQDVTSESTEKLILALKKVMADNIDLLNSEEAKETIEKMTHTLDVLNEVDKTFHLEVVKEDNEKNSTSTEGTLDITSLRGFPEFDIKIFIQWSKTTVLSGFEVWFKKAVKPMVEIIKHDYAANDIRREDTSTWDEQIWLYHTGFLMLCNLNDEDLRSWAESVWKEWLDDGEKRFSHIKQILQVVLWGLAEEPDKDYVISQTSHDAIPRREQEEMEEEAEKIDSERGLDLNFLN